MKRDYPWKQQKMVTNDFRWNPDRTDRPGGAPMVTINDDTGRICCQSTDPTHMCPECKAKMKGRRGRTDNALVANSAREPVNEFGLTANQMVDVDEGAFEGTRKAMEHGDRANQTGQADHQLAAVMAHATAERQHDDAAEEREGLASSIHSQFARDHRMLHDQYQANHEFALGLGGRPIDAPIDNDYEDDVDDSSDATQNRRTRRSVQTQNHSLRSRRPNVTRQLISNREAAAELAYWRSQHLDPRAFDQIARRIRIQQGVTANCQCDDSLIPPTMGEILGIAAPTTNSSMPNPGELTYNGLYEGDDVNDLLIAPLLSYDRLAANVTGSAAGHSGHSVPGGKGFLTESARDRVNVPGFNISDAMDRHFPDGNTGSYPRVGVRDVPPLTSGRPRVKPTLGPPESGGNVGSYPSQGTRGDMGSTDSAGDDYEDDSAPAGRGAGTSRPRGSRSDRGRATTGAVPQYDAPMQYVDKGDLERGQVHTAGMSNAIYAADYWKRMTPGGIGEGANALPQDADGEDYMRSPTQDEDDDRRQFGNQRKRRPTANQRDEDMLIAPTMSAADWQQQSATWSKGASR
jgi:hypothetical protein